MRWRDHITSDGGMEKGTKNKRMTGHILRLPDHRHSKVEMKWIPFEGKGKRGKPRNI